MGGGGGGAQGPGDFLRRVLCPQVPPEQQTEDSPVSPLLAGPAVRYLLRHGAQLPMYARGRPAGERGAGR